MNDRDHIIATNIEIKYQEGQRTKDLQKEVTLRLFPLNIPMNDSLCLLLTLALVDRVFRSDATWASLLAIDPG